MESITLVLHRNTNAVYSETYMKPINKLNRENAEFLNVKASGTYSDYCRPLLLNGIRLI
jgi:hypothetical protein